MRAGLPAAQHRPGCALRLAGRAEIAAIETIESAIGGEEGEAALVACDDAGGAVMNFDDVGFGHGRSFADNVGAPVACLISGFCYGRISNRRRSPPRRSDGWCACAYRPRLALDSISCGDPEHEKLHQISGGSLNWSMKWVSNLFAATSALFSASAAKRTDPSCASCNREVVARTPLQARPWHSCAFRPARARRVPRLALDQSGT